jgi:acetyltransferase-like isoleucine patch superfamily enzyme
MWKALKRIIKKIYNRLFITKGTIPNYADMLIKRGILQRGDNSEISKIYSNVFCDNNINVIVGKDCQILGQIELQSKEAQVIIGDRVYIGPDTRIFCRERIEIESDVLISWGCTILDTNFHSLKSEERKDDVIDGKKGWGSLKWKGVRNSPIIIKQKSWIGFNSIITKGVTIEEGSVIGCGSVVVKSTDKYSVYAGNPASFIKNTE